MAPQVWYDTKYVDLKTDDSTTHGYMCLYRSFEGVI